MQHVLWQHSYIGGVEKDNIEELVHQEVMFLHLLPAILACNLQRFLMKGNI